MPREKNALHFFLRVLKKKFFFFHPVFFSFFLQKKKKQNSFFEEKCPLKKRKGLLKKNALHFF